MPWIFFAFISILTVSVSNLLFRVLMKDSKSDAIVYAIAFQVICAVFTGFFALWKGFIPPPLQTHFQYFILSGILYGLGSLCMFQTVKYLEASDAAILTTAGTIITILASIVFLHESFSLNTIFGTILILIAVYIIDRSKKIVWNKGTLFAFTSAILMGLGVTVDAYILKSYDAVSYTPIAFLIPGIIISIFYPKAVMKIPSLIMNRVFRNILLVGLLYSIQAVTYYLALENGAGLSRMAPVFKANVILTVLLAVIFLRERDNLGTKFVSAILVTAGVLLLM